ncbi:TetR/AcrR family transcriptional regulator [Nocardioides sp. BP30]|uniref:TetR/AcrR family transcriptional regulator n=1 Tax=Nocardioides sp. BP30 TaxID=3036374 RepID=UPI002468E9E9|nr:TetR/AcrR family transcriptional regulator [Nocardioides sp. BP30]WGL52982.1 TetR/AcrR family transcriptional regulator [Nocardioides sp. BP30]
MVTLGTTTRRSARRDELLDGLVALFLAEGFRIASIEDWSARLQCSKSTLYQVAPSKEQLIVAVVRDFFRRATEAVETRIAEENDPIARIGTYLEAISAQLAPASPAFFTDLEAFEPAREIYLRNTAIAAARVQELVATANREADASASLDAAFVGAVAGTVMAAIQRGEIKSATSLDDAAAYRLLADLIVAGVTRSTVRNGR